MTEKELLIKVKQKNQKAFTLLVEQHKSLVFNTAIGFLHNKVNAEDVTQEVFIKTWTSIESFRGESKISTWLYRLTVNMSINYLKKNTNKNNIISIDKKNNENSAMLDIEDKNQNNSDKLLTNKEHSKALKYAIDSLSQRQRTSFILNKYENLSYKDIAEVMEISISSVESLLHRAKKNLQKKLLNYYKKTASF